MKELFEKLKNTSVIFYVLVIALGLIPLLWFKGNLITGEEFYSLDYGAWGELYSHAWADSINFGEYSSTLPFRFQGYYFQFLNFIGVGYYSALVSWHILLWTLTGLAFYVFLKTIYKDKIKDGILFLSVIFYVFHPFFLNISVLLTPPRILFIVLPIVLTLLYKYSQSNNNLKYIFYLSVVTFVCSPLYVNIPYSSIVFIPIFSFLIFTNILGKSYKNIFSHTILFSLLFLVLNLWWLLPFKIRLQDQISSVQNVTGGFVTIDRSWVNDVLSGFGSWAFREKAGDIFYFPYSKNYDAFPLAIIRFMPFVLVLFAFYFISKKYEKNKYGEFLLYIVIIFWASLFLAKGTSGFGGRVFKVMYDVVPMFWLYREPYAKFIPLVAVSSCALIPLGIYYLYFLSTKLNKFAGIMLVLLVFLAGISIGYPIWTSQVIGRTNSNYSRSPEVIFPDYWEKLQNTWTPKNGYYILYPSLGTADTHIWPSGYGGNPYLLTKNVKSITITNYQLNNPYINSTLYYLYNSLLEDSDNFLKTAEKFNISGIIFQGDTSYTDALRNAEYFDNTYRQYKTFDEQGVRIFELDTDADDAVLVDEDSIYKTTVLPVEQYNQLLKVIPENSVIEYTNDSTQNDIYSYSTSSQNYQNGAFDLTNIIDGSYELKIYGNIENISSIGLEGTELSKEIFSKDENNKVLSTVIQKTSQCCKNINLVTLDSPIQTASQDINQSVNVNLIKLENFNPKNIYEIGIEINGDTGGKNMLSILQVDTAYSGITDLGSGEIPQNMNLISFNYTPQNNMSSTEGKEYYINLRESGTQDLTYTGGPRIKTVQYKEIPIYNLLFIKQKNIGNLAGAQKPANYKRLNPSLAVVEIEGNIQDKVLQFKNSYDSRWQMFNISKDKFNDIYAKDTNAYLPVMGTLISQKGTPSLNLEGYSNGWGINQNNDSYYLIVFWPEYFANTFLLFSAILCVSGLAYIFIRRKRA